MPFRRKKTPELDFDRDTLPWIDDVRFKVEDYVRNQDLTEKEKFELRSALFHWMWHGYVILSNAIPHDLIDALLADVDEVFKNHKDHSFRLLSDAYDHLPIKETDPNNYFGKRTRLVDFHQSSVAAKKISLHENILRFIRHLFHEKVVMMQSLTFLEGSQQLIHQDHAYVVAKIPSHLCATWVALEDIDPDSGPLEYIPGSHALPMFEWGNGMFRGPGSTSTDEQFAEHIQAHADEAGLQRTIFCPKKGDVLVWHSALAHGGHAVNNPALTRWSYVTHYSIAPTFTRHYRDPNRVPDYEEINGALVYNDPINAAEENCLKRGEKF